MNVDDRILVLDRSLFSFTNFLSFPLQTLLCQWLSPVIHDLFVSRRLQEVFTHRFAASMINISEELAELRSVVLV